MFFGLISLFIGQLFGNTIVPIGTKIAAPLTGAVIFVFLRFAVATGILFILLLFSKRKKIKTSAYKGFAFLGVLLAINVILFVIGIAYTTIIMAVLIYSLTPILVGIAGHFFLDESLTKQKIAGLIVAFTGLLFLLNQSLTNSQQNTFGEPLGNVLIFIAMLSYSYYVFQSRKILHIQNNHALQTTFLTFLFTTICIVIVLLGEVALSNIAIKPLPQEGILGFLLVGGGSVAQYLFLQIGIKRTNAFTASFFQYVAPFIAGAAAIPLLHEQVTLSLITGGMLILTGVFIATTYEKINRLYKPRKDYPSSTG